MIDCFSFMNTNGMGWMMLGAGLFWLLILALLLIATAALVRYLRSDQAGEAAGARATRYEDAAP